MNKEELIPFVKLEQEHEEYSSLGHYQGKNSAPRPGNLGGDLTRSSIFLKRKGVLTSDIRQSRSGENSQQNRKNLKDGNSYILRKSFSLSFGLHADQYTFKKSYSNFYYLHKNIIRSHLLLSENKTYPKGKTSRLQRPASFVIERYERYKSLLIKSVLSTKCSRNTQSERKSTPVLYQYPRDVLKIPAPQTGHRQPLVVKITLSSASTQRVNKIARSNVSFDGEIVINRRAKTYKEPTSPTRNFTSLIKNPKVSYLNRIPYTRKTFIEKNINSFITSPATERLNFREKEIHCTYGLSRALCIKENVSAVNHEIFPIKLFSCKRNLDAKINTFQMDLLPKTCSAFEKVSENVKYCIAKVDRISTLECKFPIKDTFLKILIQGCSNLANCTQGEDTYLLPHAFCNERHILPFKSSSSTFSTQIFPKKCLNSDAEFDILSLLQNLSDFVTSTSALTLLPNSSMALILFIKSFYGNIDVYTFNIGMKEDITSEGINNRKFLEKSCVSLDINSASDCLGTIANWILGYESAENRQLYEVFISGKFLLKDSFISVKFHNLLPVKTSRYLPSFLHHNVPLLSTLQPVNHFLPYIFGTFCDSQRLPRYTAHCPKNVVSRGSFEFRIDDQRLVALTMDWMRCIGSDVMISDDQLTTALQHLLISVEKGIERLEWTGIAKTWPSPSGSPQSSTFPRCCHASSNPVDTKDSSVQTVPEKETDKDGDSNEVESTKPDVALALRNYSCVSSDSQNVSVVERNYVPNCESIATQTSSELSPSKLQDLPKSGNELMFGLAPVAVREEDPDDGYCEHVLIPPATISQVDPDLLHSQIALLPGKYSITCFSCQPEL